MVKLQSCRLTKGFPEPNRLKDNIIDHDTVTVYRLKGLLDRIRFNFSSSPKVSTSKVGVGTWGEDGRVQK